MSLEKQLLGIASSAIESQQKERDKRGNFSQEVDVLVGTSYAERDKKAAEKAINNWQKNTWENKLRTNLTKELQRVAPQLKLGSAKYKETYNSLYKTNLKKLEAAKIAALQKTGVVRQGGQSRLARDNKYRQVEADRTGKSAYKKKHAAKPADTALAIGASRLLRAPLQLAADVGENDDGSIFDKGAKFLEGYEQDKRDDSPEYTNIQENGSFGKKLVLSAVEQVPSLAVSFGAAGAATKGMQLLGAGSKATAASAYGTAAATMYPQAYLDGSDSTKDELENATAEQLATAERSQDIYKGMFDKNIKAGLSEDEAYAKARDQTISEIAEESGENVGLATLALSMMAPGVGSYTANRAAGGAVSNWGQKVFNKLAVKADASKVAKYAIPAVVGASIVGLNVAEEGAQEGYTDYVAQKTAVDVGIKGRIDTAQNTEAALMGGILGGLMGGSVYVGTRNSKLHQAQDDLKTAQQAYAEVAGQIPQLQQQIEAVSPRSAEGQALTARVEETRAALDDMAAEAEKASIPRTSLARRAPRIEPTNGTGQEFDGQVDGATELDDQGFEDVLNPDGTPAPQAGPVIDVELSEQELDAQDAQIAELIAEQAALDEAIEDGSSEKPLEESIAAAQSWYNSKRGEGKQGLAGVVSRAAATEQDTAFAQQQEGIKGATASINDYIAGERAKQQQIDGQLQQDAQAATTDAEKRAVAQKIEQREVDRAKEDGLLSTREQLAQPYESESFDTTIVGADGAPFKLARFWDSSLPATAKAKAIADAFGGQVDQNIAKSDWATMPEGVQKELHQWFTDSLDSVRQKREGAVAQASEQVTAPIKTEQPKEVAPTANSLTMPQQTAEQALTAPVEAELVADVDSTPVATQLTEQNPVVNIPAPGAAKGAAPQESSYTLDNLRQDILGNYGGNPDAMLQAEQRALNAGLPQAEVTQALGQALFENQGWDKSKGVAPTSLKAETQDLGDRISQDSAVSEQAPATDNSIYKSKPLARAAIKKQKIDPKSVNITEVEDGYAIVETGKQPVKQTDESTAPEATTKKSQNDIKDIELAEQHEFNDSNRLDHGELSIPNRTKNIDSEIDSYKRDKAKLDVKKLDAVKAKNTEKAAAEKDRLLPIKEQALVEYKQYGTAMVKAYKDKLDAKGVNARDFFRDEAKYNPEAFLKLSKKFQEEQQVKPTPSGDWRSQVGGNEIRDNKDGITVRKHDRVVHIRGANSIAANKKARELASQEIRELHYIAAKENPSDPFSEASIWLDGEGDMIRKKGTKKPSGALLPVLKLAKSNAKPQAPVAKPETVAASPVKPPQSSVVKAETTPEAKETTAENKALAPQLQVNAVRKQYEGTDKWMKAPNGKKTKLTEQQWLQVRTPAFKKWFGDWENDAANASKVVDENGEPKVMYHGSPIGQTFNVFEGDANGSIYTSDSREYASNYADDADSFTKGVSEDKKVFEVFVDTKNYFDNTNSEHVSKLADAILENNETSNAGNGETALVIDGEKSLYAKDVIEYTLQDGEGYNWRFMKEPWTQKAIKALGFDGFSVFEGDSDTAIAVYHSNQIKSATDNNGEFNPSSPDVRYSKTSSAKGLTGTTSQQIIGALQKHFGKDAVAQLMKSGKLRVRTLNDFVNSDGRLLIPHDAEGFYHRGKVVLIADNLTTGTSVATLLHELGGHAGIQSMLAPQTYMSLMENFYALVRSGNKYAVRAKSRAEAMTGSDSEARDEYIPYLITEYAQATERGGPLAVIKRFVNRVMAGVRAWVSANTGVQLKITPNDITQLAERMVKRLAEQSAIDMAVADVENVPAGQMQFSQDGVDQTDTPAFKEWFGNSKVVGKDGKPLVVYHGTNADFNIFSVSDVGIHVGTQDQANSRQSEKGSKDFKVMELYATIENPLRLADSPSWKDPLWYVQKSGIAKHLSKQMIDNIIAFQDQLGVINLKSSDGQKQAVAMAMGINKGVSAELKAKGYDGIVYKNTHDGTSLANKMKGEDAWMVFDPNQIKSATNNAGTFDSSNPDIRFSRRYSTLGTDGKPTTAKERARDRVALAQATTMSSKFGVNLLLRRHLATPQHVALLNPIFKVFTDNVQARIAYENNEAGLVQTYLPEIWDTRLIVGKKKEAMERVSKAIFDGTMADKVWSDSELQTMFNLTPQDIGFYRRSRQAIDNSVLNMTVDTLSALAKGTKLVSLPTVQRLKLAGLTPIGHNLMLQQHMTDELEKLAKGGLITPKAEARMQKQLDAVFDVMGAVAGKSEKLAEQGYAPLMRFGHYAVEIRDKVSNELDLFELYETKGQQRKAIKELKQRYDETQFTVGTGTLNPEGFKQFKNKGLSPETVQLFAAELGLDEDGAHQAYLKIAVSDRSALKRLIHRKKVPGYSEDMPRVLSAFVMSNARYSGRSLYNGEIERSIQDIEDGNLQNEAQKVFENMENPQEEFAGTRSMMFHYFMGFSPAFFFLNLTQPFTQTIPKLTAYAGVAKGHAYMAQALGIVGKHMGAATINAGKKVAGMPTPNWKGFEDKLPAWVKKEDYLRMAREGHLDPQNIYMIKGLERGKQGVASGVWGNIEAAAGWFAEVSESINRRSTMLAAFRVAKDMGDAKLKAKGFDNSYDFAVSIIQQTQGIYNKANRSGLARGNGKLGQYGPLILVFKQFTINYSEQMIRHGRDKEVKSLAVAMAWQFGLAGMLGLPFADDLRDIFEGIAYRVFGKAFNLPDYLEGLLGKSNADALMYGLASEKGRIDIYGRSSLGNIIPGTDVVRPGPTDWAEVLGASSGFYESFFSAAALAADGHYKDALITASPRYIRDAASGVEIAMTGSYRNTKGDKIMDLDKTDAVIKSLAFNPSNNAKPGRDRSNAYNMKNMLKAKTDYFSKHLAEAMYQENDERLDELYVEMDEWNDTNAEHFNVDIDKIEKSAEKRVERKDFGSAERQNIQDSLALRQEDLAGT